jgi:hypothetical protein
MVRSFLGWFVRIGTKPRRDAHGEFEARENAPLHAGQRGQEIRRALPFI